MVNISGVDGELEKELRWKKTTVKWNKKLQKVCMSDKKLWLSGLKKTTKSMQE